MYEIDKNIETFKREHKPKIPSAERCFACPVVLLGERLGSQLTSLCMCCVRAEMRERTKDAQHVDSV